MGLFLRKRDRLPSTSEHDAPHGSSQGLADVTPAQTGADAPVQDGSAADSHTAEQVGPFDATQVPTKEGFVDLGAIRLPGIQGLVMSMEMDQASGDVTAVRIHLGDSQLQLQAFAAPRSSGIWDEIRHEIAEGLEGQGGSSQEEDGPFGTELLVRMPGRGPDGRSVTTAMRFVGVDRSRWFLRGVISGPAAIDGEGAKPFIDLMRVTVIDRGDEPMAPRELLPLRLPQDPNVTPAVPAGAPVGAGVSTEELRPFERGPEITEIR